MIERELASQFRDAYISLFSTVESATHALNSASFTIAVIDYHTAGVVDETFLRLVRSRNSELPLVIVTPHDSPKLSAKLSSLKGVACLAKTPDYYRDIDNVLKKLLDRERRQAPSTASRVRDGLAEDPGLARAAAGTLAHEINNPLMTILGMTELLLSEVPVSDDDSTRKLRIIKRSANRIRRTLTAIANAAEIEVRDTEAGLMLQQFGRK
jgi:signal transduction histidine kinase